MNEPANGAGGSPAPPVQRFARWGIDPAWSGVVEVPDGAGGHHRWHVLDTGPVASEPSPPTVVCLHGNPTWSYLWVPVLRALGSRYRVVAPDLLGMGYSQRTEPRRYAQRVDDVDRLVSELAPQGPIVLLGHDWGGAIAMGWAVRRPERVMGLALSNTGIAVPDGRAAPRLIRMAATRGIRDLVTRRTGTFVRGTTGLSRRRLSAVQREAFAAPYARREHRGAIGDFVADVPFEPDHPSAGALAEVAARLGSLDVPVLLTWGSGDPVFDDDFADDLAGRFRRAAVHRFSDAGHLVVAEADVAGAVADWLRDTVDAGAPGARSSAVAGSHEGHRPLWAGLAARAASPDDADRVAYHDGPTGASVTFGELWQRVTTMASRLHEAGVRPGDRVAVLVPPSVDLVALVYGCWRLGAVTVVADRGLGLAGLRRAIRRSRVDVVVGSRRALTAARSLRWAPGARALPIGRLSGRSADGGGSSDGFDLPPPAAHELAAVLFTSGATGPAKGVRYTHAQLAAQRDALRACYGIADDDRFVAAFAPFALFGPALGIASAVPDVDVTRPGTLTAAVLDAACRSLDATMVFASPAALANVVATAPGAGDLAGLSAVRTVMSAGAPVPVATLRAMSALCPRATLHTPYGMTEVLPVADIDLDTIVAAGEGAGVCVGSPVAQCAVMIGPLDLDPGSVLTAVPNGTTGEVLVQSRWMSDGYDGLWRTERSARPRDAGGAVWHRSGDVGHLDSGGRLWIEGRMLHVIRTATRIVTPVPVEVAVEALEGVDRAAAVGVGPAGVQQIVVVVEGADDGLADASLTSRVRERLAEYDVAAVCTMRALPVDIRHNAKIDRVAVAAWAESMLAGGRG